MSYAIPSWSYVHNASLELDTADEEVIAPYMIIYSCMVLQALFGQIQGRGFGSNYT